ncbi:MAG TPA: UvrB/UvrC motif-containing protein [Clostridia bacterium]|jgi:protein-arginine kinase activator protein McsA
MLCENCKKREGYPNVYILNGVTKVRYLCPECNSQILKQKMGTGLGSGFLDDFGDIFNDLGDIFDQLFGVERNSPSVPSLKCPRCGTTSKEFLETAFVGCARCYEVFAPIMDSVIRKCQKDTIHTGKGPNGIAKTYINLQRLNAELKKAVQEERYEDAALIKKQIEQLKGNQK